MHPQTHSHENGHRRDWIYVTKHAADRWHQRTSEPGVGPRVAWLDGDRVNPEHLTGEKIRYHEPTQTYLVAWGPRLVTVVRATEPAGGATRGVVA